MNCIRRYMVLKFLLLIVMPVMGQQKEDKEIKLNEEAVKLIQLISFRAAWIIINLRSSASKENGWSLRILLTKEYLKSDGYFYGKEAEEIYPYVSLFYLD